jgi:hypothetical protein
MWVLAPLSQPFTCPPPPPPWDLPECTRVSGGGHCLPALRAPHHPPPRTQEHCSPPVTVLQQVPSCECTSLVVQYNLTCYTAHVMQADGSWRPHASLPGPPAHLLLGQSLCLSGLCSRRAAAALGAAAQVHCGWQRGWRRGCSNQLRSGHSLRRSGRRVRAGGHLAQCNSSKTAWEGKQQIQEDGL